MFGHGMIAHAQAPAVEGVVALDVGFVKYAGPIGNFAREVGVVGRHLEGRISYNRLGSVNGCEGLGRGCQLRDVKMWEGAMGVRFGGGARPWSVGASVGRQMERYDIPRVAFSPWIARTSQPVGPLILRVEARGRVMQDDLGREIFGWSFRFGTGFVAGKR